MTNTQNINPFTLQNRLRISSLNNSRSNNSLSINPFKISDQFYYKMQAMQYQNQQKPFYQQPEFPVQLQNEQKPQYLTSETPVQARLAPQQYYKPENQMKIQPFNEIDLSKLQSIAIDNTFDSNLKNFLHDIPSQTPTYTHPRITPCIPQQKQQDKLNQSICQDQSFPNPMYRENLVKEQPQQQKQAQIHKIIDSPLHTNNSDHKLSHRKRIFDNYPKVQLFKRIIMEKLDDEISDLIKRYDIQALYQGHNYPQTKSYYSPTKSNSIVRNQEEINFIFCTLCDEFINDKQLDQHSRHCTIKQIVDPQDRLTRINEKLKKIGQLLELKYQSRRDDNDKQIKIRKLAYISIVIMRQFWKEHAKQIQMIKDLSQVLKLVQLLHDDDNVGELIQQAIEFGQIILSYK